MNHFSAVLEPFGLRDASGLDNKFYHDRVRHFLGGLRAVLRDDKETEVFFSIHLCFLVDTSAERLLTVICNLRRECLREGRVVPFTAILTKGRAQFHRIAELFTNHQGEKPWRPPSITQGEFCNDVASALFGRLAKIKAIAIAVDPSVASELKSSRIRLFESHFITDYSQARLKSFTDVLFRPEDLSKPDVRENILREFRQTALRSRKLGRFFIPVLVNWCRTNQLLPNPPPKGPSLTKYAIDQRLGGVRDGIGIEVVYCALLERLASQDKDLTIHGSRSLLQSLAQHRWLRDSSRSDSNSSRYAHELVSEDAKRWFATKLSDIEYDEQPSKAASKIKASK